MSLRFSFRCVVAAGALALLATSCSSPASRTAVVVPTTNTGLCKLVSPSVIATTLSESMAFPSTLRHNLTTECVYRTKAATPLAVIIRYDTDTSSSAFSKIRDTFEQRHLKLGPITGLGDKAYYFADAAGQSTVTSVVVAKGSLQLLVTATATLDQVGSIARYALNQFETAH